MGFWPKWKGISEFFSVEATKSFKNRAHDAFKDEKEREFAKDYLNQIYSNIRSAETILRNSIIRLFFIFFLFYLLINTQINELGIGPIKVGDISLVIKILPLLISINYYEVISIWIMVSFQKKMGYEVLSALYSPIIKNDLQIGLYVASTPHLLEIYYEKIIKKGFLSNVNSNIYDIFLFSIIVGAILIECLIFSICYKKFGSDYLLSFVLSASFIFLLKSILNAIISYHIINQEDPH